MQKSRGCGYSVRVPPLHTTRQRVLAFSYHARARASRRGHFMKSRQACVCVGCRVWQPNLAAGLCARRRSEWVRVQPRVCRAARRLSTRLACVRRRTVANIRCVAAHVQTGEGLCTPFLAGVAGSPRHAASAGQGVHPCPAARGWRGAWPRISCAQPPRARRA